MIHTLETGKGDHLVLIHGFCETHQIWEPILAKLASSFRITLVDLPGFGENPPLDSPVTIDQLADEVYEAIKNSISGPVVVSGHSLGGYVALALAERYPDLLRGLSLFHSTANADTAEKKSSRDKTVSFMETHGIEPFIDSFSKMLFGNTPDEEALNFLVSITAKTPLSTAIAITRAMRDRPDRKHVLSSLNIPVQFIIGKKDNAVAIETMYEQISLAAESFVHVLHDVGHIGMIEAPRQTAAYLKQFTSYCYQK